MSAVYGHYPVLTTTFNDIFRRYREREREEGAGILSPERFFPPRPTINPPAFYIFLSRRLRNFYENKFKVPRYAVLLSFFAHDKFLYYIYMCIFYYYIIILIHIYMRIIIIYIEKDIYAVAQRVSFSLSPRRSQILRVDDLNPEWIIIGNLSDALYELL